MGRPHSFAGRATLAQEAAGREGVQASGYAGLTAEKALAGERGVALGDEGCWTRVEGRRPQTPATLSLGRLGGPWCGRDTALAGSPGIPSAQLAAATSLSPQQRRTEEQTAKTSLSHQPLTSRDSESPVPWLAGQPAPHSPGDSAHEPSTPADSCYLWLMRPHSGCILMLKVFPDSTSQCFL